MFGNSSRRWVYRFIFDAICYVIRYEKTEKVDQCNNFQDEIGTELHKKLLGLRERLQRKLEKYK